MAAERKATGDLRLLSPLLDAIEDDYGPISNLVTEQALPALGPGVHRTNALRWRLCSCHSFCLGEATHSESQCRMRMRSYSSRCSRLDLSGTVLPANVSPPSM